MEVRELALQGILELRPRIIEDERGYFFESYNKEVFKKLGIDSEFMQDNQSFSRKGVVRGLHLQSPPNAQGKLVRVISGSVLDVVVDIRMGSPTFGQHLSLELSADAQNMMYIPAGFAHGFSALTDCVFQYKCTETYKKEAEMGIFPFDSDLKIQWNVLNPIASEKDIKLSKFKDFNSPFSIQ